MDPTLAAVLDRADAGFDLSLSRLFELLRIPSVSTDPAYRHDCARAADWLAAELSSLGFTATVRPTAGHPMVVAHAEGGSGPHVLFYGHYDVQPVDPESLWSSPPFAPKVADAGTPAARILGRGASDDKGQLMTFVEACRAWRAATGGLPVQVSILLEGEEESGSPNLRGFLEANRDELGAADIALICDTGMWDRTIPQITTMLRGLVGEEVEITCADQDLHSGSYGGAARNPIRELARVLAALHDESGRVALPGFYDGVDDLPPDIRAQWQRFPFDEAAFLGGVGLARSAGETGYGLLETIWARPTCEVNGIAGGYAGEGFKTVIPSKASAKVSFRLVGRQDPARIREAFRRFVTERLPADCRVAFKGHGGSPAVALPFEGEWLRRAATALAEEWGHETALAGAGGSIPVAGDFKSLLGLDALMVGFARRDDRVHSPNEKYDLESFHKGTRSWARILGAFRTA